MAHPVRLRGRQLPADCFVFKHSTRCPVSAGAAEEVRRTDLELPLYWIDAIEQRKLSNWVAQEYSVTHESPQLIEIRDAKVVRVLNHSSIRSPSI